MATVLFCTADHIFPLQEMLFPYVPLRQLRKQDSSQNIAPMSIIQQISHKSNLTFYKLKNPPPPRICYEIRNRYPTLGRQKAIDVFHQELKEYIDGNPDICTFANWMLNE